MLDPTAPEKMVFRSLLLLCVCLCVCWSRACWRSPLVIPRRMRRLTVCTKSFKNFNRSSLTLYEHLAVFPSFALTAPFMTSPHRCRLIMRSFSWADWRSVSYWRRLHNCRITGSSLPFFVSLPSSLPLIFRKRGITTFTEANEYDRDKARRVSAFSFFLPLASPDPPRLVFFLIRKDEIRTRDPASYSRRLKREQARPLDLTGQDGTFCLLLVSIWPIDFPGVDLLTRQEKQLCEVFHIRPQQYFVAKEALLRVRLHFSRFIFLPILTPFRSTFKLAPLFFRKKRLGRWQIWVHISLPPASLLT